MTRITEHIWVGDSRDAGDFLELRSSNITHILNCAEDLPPKLSWNDEFTVHHVGFRDGENHPSLYKAAIALLSSIVGNNNKVLVHCHEGKSRSVFVTACFLVSNGVFPSLATALETIGKLRSTKVANGHFLFQPEKEHKTIIITAFNSRLAKIGNLCVASILGHCDQFQSTDYAVLAIPPSYTRPPSWFKVGMIRQHLLMGYDQVLWVDADTIITSKVDLAKVLKKVDLNVAKDENGINCGVMAWSRNSRTLQFLAEVDTAVEFENHPWWEQAAIMSKQDEVCIHLQPKHLFNAYPKDSTEESWVLHWPGMSVEQKLPLMEDALKRLC